MRKILVGALLSTLVLGVMTAGVRAGDAGRSPAGGRDIASREADLGGRDLAGRRGCDTLRCINKTFRQIIKALNDICVVPVTQYGNPNDDYGTPGYIWDQDADGSDLSPDFTTTALDVTEANTPVGALMLVDCP